MKLSSFIKGLVVGLSFAVTTTLAWTGSSSQAPDGNTPRPLDTSSTAQTKTGTLTVGGLVSTGSVTSNNDVSAPGVYMNSFYMTGGKKGQVLMSDAGGYGTWQDVPACK